MNASARERLDIVVVARGLTATRARARDLILRGEVMIDGVRTLKPARLVATEETVSLAPGTMDYVSRGAFKLQAALSQFALDATGRIALDLGASTGGFTEVLLAAGASRVYAVENGTGQLHPRIARDVRVVSMERTDARMLDRALIPEPVGAIAADLSFISLTKVLPASLPLAAPKCWLVALIKPQFELEPADVPRDGVIKDEPARQRAVAKIAAWIGEVAGWQILGVIPSPLHGGDGNVEFLIVAVRHA